MIDFIRAALPWVLAGLGAAVAIVKFNDSKKKDIQINDNMLALGAAAGMIGGFIVGMLIKPIGSGTGTAVGMLWGLVAGMYIRPKEKQQASQKAVKHKKKAEKHKK